MTSRKESAILQRRVSVCSREGSHDSATWSWLFPLMGPPGFSRKQGEL